MAPRKKLIAAIDFGTHGTGFAWALASEQEREPASRRIHVFDDWAGQPANYIKNLTAVLLDSSGETLEWGYQAHRRYLADARTHPGLEYHEKFKTGLLPAGSGNNQCAAQARPGRTAHELTVAYLTRFYRFALEHIVAGTGVAENEILWCLTVPSIWPDLQRQTMRECAMAAGIPAGHEELLIAVEPEVAALYCRHDAGHTGLSSTGDRFMVVDAGGGTVDMTAYEVISGGLSEIGYTSGGGHGSTYVDQRFREVLDERLGSEFMARAARLEPTSVAALLGEWERSKRSYDPARGQPVVLPVPHRLFRLLDETATHRLAASQGGVDDEIVLTPDEVTGLFDYAIHPILRLVDNQLRRIGKGCVDSVLLVGGFAQSRYLQARLKEHLPGRAALVVPARPAWAVLLGAVHYGLEPVVIRGRRNRLSYGVSAAAPFEPLRDPPEYRLINHQGAERCDKRFDMFVRADDVIEPGHIVRRTFLPLYHDQREITLRVYASTDPEPRYVTEQSCIYVGELTLDIAATSSNPPDRRTVEMTMVFGGTEIEAWAREVATGKEVKASIHFATEEH